VTGNPDAGLLLGLDGGGGADFGDWLEAIPQAGTLPVTGVSPADTALIGFTSGSTGAPKCVHTSHEAVFRSTESMQALFGFGPDDVFCTATDFSALSAFRSLVTVPLLTGAQVVLPSVAGLQSPLALAGDCAAHGVTRLTAIPAVLRSLVAAAARVLPMPALRMVLSGSGILDQTTRSRFHTAFGVAVIDYYAGREFGTALYADPLGSETVSSGGGVPCNSLVAIIDDDGALVADGEIGMIMVHSDCLMQDGLAGNNPDWQGWHETGDLGRRDAAGRIQIVGRRREVIKASDGSLVFPIEVEALLMTMPEVGEAAVVGFTSNTGIEHIVAVIIPATPLPADFEHRARSHVLAAAGQHRVPSRVIAVEDLPRVGAAAKIDRAALRAGLSPLLDDLQS
jgi:acyl-coenzyme A synthetase/AMP-(fatty) acid ligase